MDSTHSGLTPASLKHLKRQRDALAEDKIRLQAEVASLSESLREQRERAVALEAELKEAEAREAAAKEEAQQAREAERRERARAEELERLSRELQESVERLRAEAEELRQALDAQRQLTRDVCQAAQARMEEHSVADTSELDAHIKLLESQLEASQFALRQSEADQEELKIGVATAMAAAEKAMTVHALMLQQMSQLKAVRLEEAMNHKVELHISVPRVTVTYNGAPPLHVSLAVGLTEEKVRNFLEAQVFPHFEPLWVSLDTLCKAPDGSTKKEYATKMLDRLSVAIKGFITRSQNSKGASLDSAPPGAAEAHSGGSGAGGAAGAGSLADADRRRLLEMLQAGDDRGLDSKLQELLRAGR